ncbi:hypothetical protein [Streptomyces tubercidicus]|uniref:hypothetical protein n=1 Tax=Streptomyces tubercidicus TaxID=47759 RepID=UPI00379BC727
MPDDYFGRLLARHAPAVPADPFAGTAGAAGSRTDGPRRTLVQPRLPGPFERVEALRGEAGEPDEPAALSPHPPPPQLSEGERVRYEREIRTTERETTVLRAEAPAPDTPDTIAPAVRSTASLLRPTAFPDPGPRPATPDGARPQRRAGAREVDDGPARTAASASVRPGAPAAPVAAVPALRPRTEGGPAARPAARAAATGRRGQRGAERVVHVQIGRLEVSAAGPERPAAGSRPAPTERPAPSLSLADYLARGGEGEGT